MPSSRWVRRRSATSRRKALPSGKPRITWLPVIVDRPAGLDQRLDRRAAAQLGHDPGPGGDQLGQASAGRHARGRHGRLGRRDRLGRQAGRSGRSASAGLATLLDPGDVRSSPQRAVHACRGARPVRAPSSRDGLELESAGLVRFARPGGLDGLGGRWGPLTGRRAWPASRAPEPVRRDGDRRGRRRRRRLRRRTLEEGQLELEAEAADRRPARVDRRQPPADGDEVGQRPGGGPASPSWPVSARRTASTTWSRKTCRSRPRSSRPSMAARPASASAAAPAHRGSRGPSPHRPARAGRRPAPRSAASSPEARTWSRIDSASRIPPAASRATSWIAPGSAVRPSAARIRSSLPAIWSTLRRVKSKRWTRDRTAGRIWLASVVQKMKTTWSGGSSRVLRRTSQPSLIRWTSSTM